MASETAVVATETLGAIELIRNNETGRLTKIADPVDLAKTSCELLKSDLMRNDMAEKARDFAAENFSLERIIEQTEEVYRNSLEN